MRTIDRLPRRHLLAWLVVAVAVVGGLLGMHALNLHASHAAHGNGAHASATHDAGAEILTHDGHGAAALAEHACDDCDTGGGGVFEATACVLALLATLLLLPRPRSAIASLATSRSVRRATPPIPRDSADLAPSRYALSVVRT